MMPAKPQHDHPAPNHERGGSPWSMAPSCLPRFASNSLPLVSYCRLLSTEYRIVLSIIHPHLFFFIFFLLFLLLFLSLSPSPPSPSCTASYQLTLPRPAKGSYTVLRSSAYLRHEDSDPALLSVFFIYFYL
ncbi:uncharacterized protein BO72DRAFT_234415 [Aspergillus fijiensis CBS 313.89]|uniref:Uncharacterized protein n=1 Tax=Aspergillus fijiensis CBS 313.89 TaxID=1448319 RepID=A0A8G1RHR1_9EURO|nr:uncharacterized protein BO72DRAFT_234415 [Aspergillus fijiensis CBS 313.89]RAK73479.1 hypothetical protein BO72DRAFT_234415 [Aspergillus fijiensis CBS 313.89]